MVGFITTGSAALPEGAPNQPVTAENTPAAPITDIAEDAFKTGIFSKVNNWAYMKGVESSDEGKAAPLLTPVQAKAQYGIDVKQPTPEPELQFAKQTQDAQDKYESASRNAPWYTKFGADAAAALLDPIQDAAYTLIPGAGEARIAGAFGKVGLDASGFLGKAAVRATEGATQFGAAQVPISAANYGLSQDAHQSYTIADGLRETLFSAALGAITMPFAGAIHDAFKDDPMWAQMAKTKYNDNNATASVAINQAREELQIDVLPIYKRAEGVLNDGAVEASHEQNQLIKEGTMLGLPQEELRAAMADAKNAAETGVYTPEHELDDLRKQSDDMEQAILNAHTGNAEIEGDFQDANQHKDNEQMLSKVHDNMIKCLNGVGYV